MGKHRDQLSASEVEGLYEDLDLKLDKVGIPTQPEVATRILELASNPDAGPGEFAKVLKNDSGMMGRLLKMANSAFFAQRGGVSTAERACVVLGMERLKAVSLGFYLSRDAVGNCKSELSREIWGVSLFRACLANELSHRVCPQVGSESFVVGLLLDAGIPLMVDLVGEDYVGFVHDARTPAALFRSEFTELEFTHADVVTALCRRWNLPELIAKPIEWRYVPPGSDDPTQGLQRLQRIAHYAGAVALDPESGMPKGAEPSSALANKLFGVMGSDVRSITKAAATEYELTSGLFSAVAETFESTDRIAAMAHNQLVDLIEQNLIEGEEGGIDAFRFVFDGMRVELRKDVEGHEVAVVYGAEGDALVSYRFIAGIESPEQLLRELGIQAEPSLELDRLRVTIDTLAA